MNAALARVLLFFIQIYRATLSPLLGSTCRFSPSCSHYAEVAIARFGPWRGSWLGFRRVLRCHPWNPGGHDPVPSRDGEAPSIRVPEPQDSTESVSRI